MVDLVKPYHLVTSILVVQDPETSRFIPTKVYSKRSIENSDNVVLFTFEGDVLPVLPIPDDVPTQGIVDIIVVNSGYDYLLWSQWWIGW